jgi:LuxR family maltose regulon positive regulatory protein
MYLDGRIATGRELLSAFPADRIATDPELALLAAAALRAARSLQEADRYLGLAERMSASVSEDRQARFQVALGLVRLHLARARNCQP